MNRDERRKWEGDAYYDAWCRGMNPDNLNPDRMFDAFYEGKSPEQFVSDVRWSAFQKAMEREDERQREAEYWDAIDEQNRREQP